MLKWLRSKLWLYRTKRLGRGTHLAMEFGAKHAADNPPNPRLIAAVRAAMQTSN